MPDASVVEVMFGVRQDHVALGEIALHVTAQPASAVGHAIEVTRIQTRQKAAESIPWSGLQGKSHPLEREITDRVCSVELPVLAERIQAEGRARPA
jgi:hypothetical protein